MSTQNITITNDVFPYVINKFEEQGLTIFIPRIFYMKLSTPYIIVLVKSPVIILDDVKSVYKINPIFVDDADWELAKFYYQFDIWGEILSRLTEFIIHRNRKTIHYKFNATGLYAWYGSIRKPVAQRLLSKDPVKICEWMGIDYDYIMSGDSIYEPNDLNIAIRESKIFEITRMPNKKAKYISYVDFGQFPDTEQQYQNAINMLAPYFEQADEFVLDSVLDELDPMFGVELNSWKKLLEFNWRLNRLARHKFNGYALWKKTGLGGGPLRQQMYHFKRQVSKWRWPEYIFNNSVETILEDFDEFSKPTQKRIEEFNKNNP